jgi:hypothetical protein
MTMRYLSFLIFAAAFLAVVACAKSSANQSVSNNDSANNAPVVGASVVPIATPVPNEEVRRITLADAKKAFDDGTGYFVDARPESAYNDEHIKGAVNITYDKLDSKLKELASKKKIIVYCS